MFAEPTLIAPQEQHFTGFTVRVDDEHGKTMESHRYEPHGLRSDFSCELCAGEAVAVDHGFVFGRIRDVLYRFRWNEPDAATALGEARSFVGRTSTGEIIVTRRSGTWALDPADRAARGRLLSRERTVVLHRTFGKLDVFGFASGNVVVVDGRNAPSTERSNCVLVDAARIASRLVFACGGAHARVDAVAI